VTAEDRHSGHLPVVRLWNWISVGLCRLCRSEGLPPGSALRSVRDLTLEEANGRGAQEVSPQITVAGALGRSCIADRLGNSTPALLLHLSSLNFVCRWRKLQKRY
jgi:hypothetical protein